MRLTRRGVIGTSGALTGLATLGVPAIAAGKAFKIGYVSPQTDPLAPFGEADAFVLETIRAHFKPGVAIGGKTVAVASRIFTGDLEVDQFVPIQGLLAVLHARDYSPALRLIATRLALLSLMICSAGLWPGCLAHLRLTFQCSAHRFRHSAAPVDRVTVARKGATRQGSRKAALGFFGRAMSDG